MSLQLFQALAEHKNKFERDMLLNRQNMSDDEYKRLLKEHEREMEALSQNLEAEKDRQKRIIADKVRNDAIYSNKIFTKAIPVEYVKRAEDVS